jgi:diaminopimelate decarboxylase
VACVTAESADELALIAGVAARLGLVAPVALRVNPEVQVHAFHDYVKTGEKGDKFGVPLAEAAGIIRQASAAHPSLRFVALQHHIGSLLTELGPYRAAADRLVALLGELRASAPEAVRHVTTLDLGGGFGVPYADEAPVDLAPLTDTARAVHAATGCTIAVEPGRFLVAEAGVLLARVLYRKQGGGRTFVVADAGMNDLLRPALYGAHHRVEAVEAAGTAMVADLVGPVCESGDFLARDRTMDAVAPGALLAVHTAGAYGFVMSSNYNARPRAAEVLVDGARWGVIRPREALEDLVRGERADPDWSMA